jgi:hypothetical protein
MLSGAPYYAVSASNLSGRLNGAPKSAMWSKLERSNDWLFSEPHRTDEMWIKRWQRRAGEGRVEAYQQPSQSDASL